MIKKIKLESFKYRFLTDASKLNFESSEHKISWTYFLESLKFSGNNIVASIIWDIPNKNKIDIDLKKFIFYGDNLKNISFKEDSTTKDNFKLHNSKLIKEIIFEIANKSNFQIISKNISRIKKEEEFHDAWAEKTNTEEIDVIKTNEVCTAPEMRYIKKKLGSLKNKKLLDVGCGLGEASVYFAIKGADVTSLDLSSKMLSNSSKLAELYNVKIATQLASAEDLNLPVDCYFDIVYAGNLLHHVDISKTLDKIVRHMKPGSRFVSWDPIEYNPIINIYRNMAKDVRTPDEHPIRKKDIVCLKKYFNLVEVKYFWFFTLIIFVLIFLFQRKNPNKVRFWKLILQEGEKWKWLYLPLEKLDKLVLKVFPPLRWLCWNIVIVGYK